MLLLFHFLEEQQELERRRLLIDTLLHVSEKTAASICRVAGVRPGNLSRFRRPGGEKLVSSEFQDRILAALGWPNGEIDPKSRQVWVIRDNDGLLALQWLLQDRSTSRAKLQAMPKLENSIDLHWSGELCEGGLQCLISIGSYLKLIDGTSAESMMTRLISAETRTNIVSRVDAEAMFPGKVAKEVLHQILKKNTVSDPSSSLRDCRVELGLTDAILDQLIENWIRTQARDSPQTLIKNLSNIDKIRLGGVDVSPSSMTTIELQRFVQMLAG